MPDPIYAGLLCIGDPHLASRAPGFRKDNYPATVLGKLRWSLNYARENRLLPVLLGDLFDFPRDNANWLLVDLLGLCDPPVIAISGNHDCKENALSENDTLSVLVASGHVRLLDRCGPSVVAVGGCTVVIGGTCWGQKLPTSFERSPGQRWVFWITHHDLRFPGYEEAARFSCREVPGIDAVINGHIHRSLPQVTAGATTWMNPGNIARVARSDASRSHIPSVLRIDVGPDRWAAQRVTIPHQPFDEVFHPAVAGQSPQPDGSSFIRELAALESIRTASGAGLAAFLDVNLPQFDPRVAEEIRLLAKEVLEDAR